MKQLEFGVWDGFAAHEMALSPVAADVYEQHLREAQLAEELGYHYYFTIEHQNSHVGQITAPSVYLCAVAQRVPLRRGPACTSAPWPSAPAASASAP